MADLRWQIQDGGFNMVDSNNNNNNKFLFNILFSI